MEDAKIKVPKPVPEPESEPESEPASAAEVEVERPVEDLPFLRVCNMELTAADLLEYLRLTLQVESINNIVRFTVLESELDKHGIVATEEEVAEVLSSFRADRGLLTAESTNQWLAKQHLSLDYLWRFSEYRTRLRKLRQKMFDDERLREEFALTKTTLSKIEYYQIVVDDHSKAAELAALIGMKSSFFELAWQHSEDAATRKQCGYGGIRCLTDFDAELQLKLVAANEGDIIGPLKSRGQYYIVFVAGRYPAVFNEETREMIANQLFEKWCHDCIATTPVEWVADNAEDE